MDFCIHSGPAVGTNQSKSGDRKTQECLPLGQPNNRKVIDVQVCQLDLGSSAPQDSPVWLDTSLPDKTRDEKEKTCAWALLTYIELMDQKPLTIAGKLLTRAQLISIYQNEFNHMAISHGHVRQQNWEALLLLTPPRSKLRSSVRSVLLPQAKICKSSTGERQ